MILKCPEAETRSTGDSRRNSPTGSNESADVDALADAMKESPAGSDHNSAPEMENNESGDTRISALELENRLLKNEVSSLNQEMTTVIQRAKTAQTGMSYIIIHVNVQWNLSLLYIIVNID